MSFDEGRRSDLRHLMCHIDQLPSEGFADILSDIIEGTPVVLWELGPHPTDYSERVLALSADGREEALEQIKTIFGLPLQGECWSVQVGIPPKAWEGYFVAELEGGKLDCESAEWCWVQSFQCDTGKPMHLKVWGKELSSKAMTTAKELVQIALFGELGEWNVAKFVTYSPQCFSPPPVEGKPFSQLRRHFLENVPAAYSRELLAELMMA